MSIIRLSVLKDIVYAPDVDGDIKLLPYNRRRRVGRMEKLTIPDLAPPNGDLRHFLSRAVVDGATAELAPEQPVVIMVHGFLFDPKQAVSPDPKETDNPHGRVYHFHDGDERDEQRHHTTSWPRWLGFEPDDATGRSGLAIAFGWQSQPGFASALINYFENFYARAYDNAGRTAWALVSVIDVLADLLENRAIDLVCHSLGSRVVVRAIALAAKHQPHLIERLGRIIILGGAEYVVEAQLMQRRVDDLNLASGPAFYNFVSRENDVLDKLAENFGPRTFGNSQVIGHNGLDVEGRSGDWIDLQIDSAKLQNWMNGRGFEVSGDRPGNVWDHWYYYTFRRNMRVYENILRRREDWVIPALRDADIPDGVSKGWSIFGD